MHHQPSRRTSIIPIAWNLLSTLLRDFVELLVTNNTFFPSARNWSNTYGAPGINDSPFLQYIASNRGDDGNDEQSDGESDDGNDCNGDDDNNGDDNDDDDEQTEDDDMYCIWRGYVCCRVHTNELTKYCYHMTPSQSKMKTSVLTSNSSADPRISLMFSRIFFTG